MRFGYRRTASAAAALLSLATVVAGQKICKPKVDSAKLQADITEENLMKNLQVLNDLAYANGGNRAFGLPGNQATVDYIFDRVSNVPGTKAWKQEFGALFNLVTSIKLSIAGADTYVYGLTYSPSTSEEGITADLVLGPEGAAGCDLANYSGLDVAGKIVLVDRFRCPTGGTLAGRVLPASKAGAAAVIVYSDVETKVTAGSLSAPSSEFRPAGFINRVDGLAAKARIQAGEKVSVHFQQTQLLEERKTHNIFVETEDGDPNSVIVLGAHHDSVQAGPGINDDASGSSLLIELFHALTKYRTKNKVRFAWWAAEENGLVGSKHYCNSLEAAEINKILAYLVSAIGNPHSITSRRSVTAKLTLDNTELRHASSRTDRSVGQRRPHVRQRCPQGVRGHPADLPGSLCGAGRRGHPPRPDQRLRLRLLLADPEQALWLPADGHPADRGPVLPPGVRQHHQHPAGAAAPQRARRRAPAHRPLAQRHLAHPQDPGGREQAGRGEEEDPDAHLYAAGGPPGHGRDSHGLWPRHLKMVQGRPYAAI
ncbi:hypothetical protein RB594_007118 [Gaeumannomyces avenae]